MYVPVEAVTQLRICEEGVDERTDRQTQIQWKREACDWDRGTRPR